MVTFPVNRAAFSSVEMRRIQKFHQTWRRSDEVYSHSLCCKVIIQSVVLAEGDASWHTPGNYGVWCHLAVTLIENTCHGWWKFRKQSLAVQMLHCKLFCLLRHYICGCFRRLRSTVTAQILETGSQQRLYHQCRQTFTDFLGFWGFRWSVDEIFWRRFGIPSAQRRISSQIKLCSDCIKLDVNKNA